MKLYLAEVTFITTDDCEWKWQCVVYDYKEPFAEAKVKRYIKECPHFMNIKEVLDIEIKTVAVVA